LERWLGRVSTPLAAIVEEQGPAAQRLRRWLDALIAVKQQKVQGDPELFATYVALAAGAREVIAAHVDLLSGQLSRIIADGVAQGEFAVADPTEGARAVIDATSRFHNPAHAAEWSDPGISAAFERVWALVVRGLKA
jgi:hypothetical protein